MSTDFPFRLTADLSELRPALAEATQGFGAVEASAARVGTATTTAAGGADRLAGAMSQASTVLRSAGFGDLATSLDGMGAAATRATTATAALAGGAGLAGLVPAIGAVATAAGAAYLVYQNWDSITEKLATTIEGLTGRLLTGERAIRASISATAALLDLLGTAEQRQRSTEIASLRGAIEAADGEQARVSQTAADLRAQLTRLQTGGGVGAAFRARGFTTPEDQQIVDRAAERSRAEQDRINGELARIERERQNFLAVRASAQSRLTELQAANYGPQRAPSDIPPAAAGGGGGGGAERTPGDAAAVLARLEQQVATQARSVVESVDPAARALRVYAEGIDNLRRAEDLYRSTQDREGGPLGLSPERVAEVSGLLKSQYLDSVERAQQANDSFAVSGREVATVFKSAFDGVITGSRNAEDALNRLLLGFARLVERIFITKPLENALNQALGSAGGGLGNLFSSLFSADGGVKGAGKPDAIGTFDFTGGPTKFAGGGIMTDRGPLPLRRYAGGGIANSPQLAMFAEGGVPEAYVPVPNGTIPVELRERRGGADAGMSPVQLHVNIDARGAGPREIEVLRAQIPAIAQAAVAEAVQRGGSYGRAVRGRR